MEVSGSYEFNATAEQVWGLLMDPKVLASCLPGVQSLDPVGADEYQAVVNVGVGPVNGRYTAKIFLRDQNPYNSLKLVLEGKGSLGFANGESLINLVEQDGKTTLNIKGDTQVGGPVARVGQRMMGSVAQGMMDRFIKCLQDSV
ncbi:MAG: carbon monoxide dehydrogenase subunit G [Chloroflexi bacterium]|nr:carbon monoxide dehydrogenase subunit G [Chloroflexota bacterium]MDA1219631.1 carbon monoxide dehydrogenase subunit G [Chloroflexota bacterium]